MGDAALNAALQEITTGLTQETNALFSRALSFEGGSLSDGPMTPVDNVISTIALRSGIEALRAAAGTSDLTMLNRLELEYGLTEGGLNGYSALTVQPLFESSDKRRSLMAQASYARKQTENQGADTDDWRETVNVGLSWRYVTPDERHMMGINAFFDHQWPYHHNRMSVGVDYKTGLMGMSANHYIGLSDWRGRNDGYEERALSGTDVELSGRLPDFPKLELFLRGYHWDEQRTAILNPDGDDIWGYRLAAEYTPFSALTVTAATTKDNAMKSPEGQIMMRFNYRFGQGVDDFWERPTYNLDSVLDRRFEKVRRNNEIRFQVRQDTALTAVVTFAQGANVSVGQSLAFGTLVTTGGGAGDSATIVFGNGARLDVGQNTQVRLESDQIVLITGLIQFTTGSGGITVIAVPGGTINLLGTDVDVRIAGGSTVLRVRDGAADYTDDTGTTRVNTEQLAEAQDGDGLPPVLRAEGTVIFETHARAVHEQLELVGPAPSNLKAAPYADDPVGVTGTLATGNVLSFTVPLTDAVNVSGSPQLRFTLGGLDRFAAYSSGSGTENLVFTYTLVGADETLSNIIVEEIEKNGGTLIGTNGAPMVRTLTGELAGGVPDATAPTIATITAASSGGDPAGIGDVITVTLNANEDLVQNGAPSLTLNIGGISRTAAFSTINSGNVEFTYTVQAGDNDADGITVTAITVAGNELEDASGNDLDTTFALPHNLSLDVSTILLGLSSCPAGNLSAPANSGCARLFGADPADINDVMVYAGDVPGTATDFFVRRCDLGQDYDPVDDRCEDGGGDPNTRSTMQWKNANTESDTVNIGSGTAWTNVNATDGPGNTTTLVNDASGTHTAAESCNALPGGGWYLPAISELDVIYANLNATDDPDHPLPTVNNAADSANSGTVGPLRDSFDLSGQWYWSSSEIFSLNAWIQRFSDGNQTSTNKTNTRDVRCARR